MKYEPGTKITVFEKDGEDQIEFMQYLVVRDKDKFSLISCYTYESLFSFNVTTPIPLEELNEIVDKNITDYLDVHFNENYIVNIEHINNEDLKSKN